MLHGETNQTSSITDSNVYFVGGDPVMKVALDVLTDLANSGKIVLKAKGSAIPNAVAIANIITEKMLKGNSKIENITVDSESKIGLRMISTIEITLSKI